MPGVPASDTTATDCAARQLIHQLTPPRPLVVFVETDEAGGNAEVAQQLTRPPGVLGSDDAHFSEHAQGAGADVLEMPDRSGHDEQRTGHILL